MLEMNSKYHAQRTLVLEQMAALQTMEQGSLKSEYREQPSGAKSGPYFKHQVWRKGANVTQRIAPEDAPAPAAALVGDLLQGAANRIDAQYQSKPGEVRKGREPLQVQCLFGTFKLQRDYYYHPGKKAGHYPSDAALGLEGSYTPGLARLICLEGADESSYLKAERHLEQTGGMAVSARQI